MKPLEGRGDHRSVNGAWADAVDPDVVWGVVDGRAFRELPESGLAQAVHGARSLADEYLIRSHEHNVAGALCSHDRENFLQDVERTFQVDGQDAFELVDAGLLDVGKEMNAGSDEQQIDTTRLREHLLDAPANLFVVRNVTRLEQPVRRRLDIEDMCADPVPSQQSHYGVAHPRGSADD